MRAPSVDAGGQRERAPLLSLDGHAAAFSPDGRTIATIISDGSLRLWDAASGAALPLAGPIDAGQSLSFSPDGSRLATIPSGNLPRIWDLTTGQELRSFPGHSDYVSTAAINPDGSDRLLTASDDGTARIWDAATGQELLSLGPHPGWVWLAAWSPDGSRAVTLSGDKAYLWDALSGELLLTLAGAREALYSAAFSPDGTRLAAGGLDRQIRIYDLASGRELLALSGHSGAVTGLAFSPDGRSRLASASDDGTLRLWDTGPAGEALSFTPPQGELFRAIFSPDGRTILGSAPGEALIWDAAAYNRTASLLGSQENPAAGSAAPLMRRLPLAAEGGAVLTISSDGALLAASAGPQIQLLSVDGAPLASWPAHTAPVAALAFSPDGSLLASASSDYKIKLWEVIRHGEPPTVTVLLKRTLDQPGAVTALAFSPNGSQRSDRLAAGMQNGAIRLLPLNGGEASWLRQHSDAISSLAFSPNGSKRSDRLASASLDGTARLWDLPPSSSVGEGDQGVRAPGTGKGSQGVSSILLAGHSDAVLSAVFSPDGQRLATASRDGTARLWDAASGQELLNFSAGEDGLHSVAFSPDGNERSDRLLAAGPQGGQVYLLQIDALVRLAKSRVSRQLTVEECQKYLHAVTIDCAAPPAAPIATSLPPAAAGRICQVTGAGGLHNDYFNALLYQGLQQAASQQGWTAVVVESGSSRDYEKNLQSLSAAGCKLIVASGALAEAVHNTASAWPEQRFLTTDFVIDPPLDNDWTQLYATDQAAFLAGYLAAGMTRSGKLGIFGGVDIPPVTDFMDGFALGVAYYNRRHAAQVELIGWDPQAHRGLFAGSFCCTTEGRQMARQLLAQGADIIVPVAGETVGWGAGAEIQQHGGAWMIGVDTDWAVSSPDLAGILLTSIEKRDPVSVLLAAQAAAAGQFSGGVHTGTLATGEVGLAPFHALESQVPPELKAELQQIAAGIIAGQIQTRP